MKKYLLSFFVFVAMGIAARVQAQCTVSNVSVELNSSITSGGNCIINFDLTFNLEHNNGNKYIWIHLWRTVDHPSIPYPNTPTSTQLANSLANIGINNNVDPPVFLTTYGPDGSVPVLDGSDGLTLSIIDGSGLTPDIVTISGITITVPGSCASAIELTADVWSTQSQSQSTAHCYTTGIGFVPNDPTITGFKLCTTPRVLNIGIQTTSTTDMEVTYSLYRDDGDGIFEPGADDPLVGGPSGPHTINSTTPYSAVGVGYTGNNAVGEKSKIWVAVSNNITPNLVISLFNNLCAPLPVSFTFFRASRTGAVVQLNWQTSYELNNTGFAIERQAGNDWEEVGFVISQALNGNSSDLLNYSFPDPNNIRGITRYRLRQIDLDGQSKYSEIRSVRGEGQPVKLTVYPNPSSDGKVNIAFDDANAIRNVSVLDMSGRVVRQINGITNNNITIENLQPGMYTVRVMVPETGAQGVEKIIVNKR